MKNKINFFSQYYGSAIVFSGCVGFGLVNYEILNDIEKGDELQYSIKLKKLSSISKKERIELLKISLPNDDHLWNDECASKFLIKIEDGMQSCIYYDLFKICDAYEYLRSRGYAIPYMGLSVETMIEYGWIKLV